MHNFTFLKLNKIDQLPTLSGVYVFKKDDKLLYIGKAINLKRRVKDHKNEKVFKLANIIGYRITKTEREALVLEAKLIKELQPKYNVNWKDDKNYFYIGITKESFPRVFVTHQTKDKNTEYIGPFINGKKLRATLKELRKQSPFRTCKTMPKKPCLWYHLGQCTAPCVLLALLKSKHIEAYDVSNIQGKEATGSMVTFIKGKPDKNLYRKFKIKQYNKANDTGMIKEIMSRRLLHPEWKYPELILVDGGKAQLNAAKEAKDKILKELNNKSTQYKKINNIRIMSLAERTNTIHIENHKYTFNLEDLPQDMFRLVVQLRDEAHRFALSYHHKLRNKLFLTE